MRLLRLFIVCNLLCIVVIFAGCSKGDSPITPSGISPGEYTSSSYSATGNRHAIAVYDVVIDPISKSFLIEPGSRELGYHFPLTQLYPNIIRVTGFGFTPNFWADIELIHPLPGTGIDGFDPRIIAILPSNPQVGFNYPVFNCYGNNSVVLEPDGYTKLFDETGGSIPGNTNPFMSYFKDQEFRVWSSTGETRETRRWNMDLSGFGGPMVYQLVVDISTKYPSLPQPRSDNAPEPVEFDVYVDSGLDQYGGSAGIDVTFLDWQGFSNIKCKVEAPDLFNNSIELF